MTTDFAVIHDLSEVDPHAFKELVDHPATSITIEHDGRTLYEIRASSIHRPRMVRMGDGKRVTFNVDFDVSHDPPSEEEIDRRIDELWEEEHGAEDGEMDDEPSDEADDVEDDGDDDKGDDVKESDDNEDKITFTLGEGPEEGGGE
jgi:hypothetical protein